MGTSLVMSDPNSYLLCFWKRPAPLRVSNTKSPPLDKEIDFCCEWQCSFTSVSLVVKVRSFATYLTQWVRC